jgi:hypothetical protein
MARKLRVQYPGAVYHVMNRGDRREAIFTDDQDRLLSLETLTEACGKTDWQIHAWCLMSNYFHLVTETPRGNFVAGKPHFPVFNLPVLMTLLSIAPLSFDLNLQALDGLLSPSIHFLPSDKSVRA